MKKCFITPTEFINNPEIGWKSDFMLVLSHLLDTECENEYAIEVKKFAENGKKLYLDNGLFENHEPESGESLLRKAELIWVEYVFAPDYLFDDVKTRKEFEIFADLKDKLNINVKLAYVVQANNPLDYINAYKWAEENPRIDLIWLSILSIPKSFERITQTDDITLNRMVCMKILQDFIQPKKDAHLLWLWSSLWDIIEAKKYHSWVKSNDSSSVFQNWLFGRYYFLNDWSDYPEVYPKWKVKEKVNFKLKEISEVQENVIKTNILEFNKILWS